MAIEFQHVDRGSSWAITSPQLPGWICAWPDQETALAKCGDSLRSYLRRNRSTLPPEIVEEIRALVAGA